jgi:hypothetical protein
VYPLVEKRCSRSRPPGHCRIVEELPTIRPEPRIRFPQTTSLASEGGHLSGYPTIQDLVRAATSDTKV